MAEEKQNIEQRNTTNDFKAYFEQKGERFEKASSWSVGDVWEGVIVECEVRKIKDKDKILMKIRGKDGTRLFVLNRINELICKEKLKAMQCANYEFDKLKGQTVRVIVEHIMFKNSLVNTFKLVF